VNSSSQVAIKTTPKLMKSTVIARHTVAIEIARWPARTRS
jgi:hypothetical protein